ncbi:hypothetical protein SBOR_4797 [Sclerotinia borealis F-4128]|uniref:Uncharacterized protein n=1 Tax=Sclerotinia borealis (strain F-4128) TaxID=1432307 RepID=W9CDM1_SCLBF|nr:hypothetical protein SBOR_4797 [Sclerotinia borealis F-4128]
MPKSKGTRRLVVKTLRECRPFTFLRKSPTQPSNIEASTAVQQDIPCSDSFRRPSSDAFATIDRRRERQASMQSDPEETRVYTPPQTPNPSVIQAPLVQTRAIIPETRAQMQERDCNPPSSDFGPYEKSNINDRRRLPFLLQHGVFFRICITLEGAIFDFIKRWVPEFLVNRNLRFAQEVELNFWERYLAAPIIPPEAFETRDHIPQFHELLDRFKETRHTFVHRKKPPVLYVDQMLADAIEMTRIIADETRAEKLDGIYQIVHHMGSLLKNQVTIESKGILEDRLQVNKHAQEMPMGWLEASRLQEEELEILRDLNHDNDKYEALYANALQALEDMMESVSNSLVG